ncbi:hypothetical protein AMS68_000382 [Peltaster fructicola]|uniref:Calponin-homology (CH) domain-containing protein n=1 Tax=Peltaster fructicola TaxID=286661 RepID=A0A6H0XJR7_9PEZI|nr:hypothetical protein AMS68_000382 [Peltaster fructicola]
MASVSSLDQDMRKLRLSRYTQTTANEARAWIENTLGHSLAAGDLLESLKDGVALCELANLVLPAPGIKFKKSAMPFVQMENISHFLRACEAQPLGLPAHDRFLTVDLYESKDPAQVLQCLGAFSRRANAVNPARFPHTIGPKKAGVVSPTTTGQGYQSPSAALQSSTRAMSPSITGGSTGSRNSTKQSPTQVSSWSTKADQGSTAPAWNPVMYGFMGGADQAKQGVSFGARRQITSASPQVPSLAEKERKRKEKEIEEERLRQEQGAERRRREAEALRQEQEEQQAEEQRWEEESRRLREQERIHLEQQKRDWEEQERKWKEDEEVRRREESASLQAVKRPPEKPRTPSGNILRGQTLSQYHKEQASQQPPVETPEQARVRELEKQLAEAREREKQYQLEREERSKIEKERQARPQSVASERPQTAQSGRDSGLSWTRDEREHIQQSEDTIPSRLSESTTIAEVEQPQPQPSVDTAIEPLAEQVAAPLPVKRDVPATTTRPLSSVRSPFARPANRTDTYLSSNAAPVAAAPRISSAAETGDTAREQSSLRDQRVASQQKTQAGAWASKSLLEREMERERERQREWQEGQDALKNAPRDTTQGTGPAQTWDVNQYGYMGGDGQNRGSSSGSGIAMGGRRQIIGPRPQP